MAVFSVAAGLFAGIHAGHKPVEHRLENDCPTARDINSHVVINVSGKNSRLNLSSTLEVRLQGVNPPDPIRPHLDFAAGASFFTECFVPTMLAAKLQYLDWSNGSITARFDLKSSVNMGAPRPGDPFQPLVFAAIGFPHSSLTVAPCGWPKPSASGLVCNPNSRTTIDVQVPSSSGFEPVAQPFPRHTEHKDNDVHTYIYTWSFPGPSAPPVTVSTDLPLQALAVGYLKSPHVTKCDDIPALDLNVRFLAYGLSSFVALLIGSFALWRSAAGWRLAGITLGALGLGSLLLKCSGVWTGIYATVAWLIVLLAAARSWRSAVVGILAAAVAFSAPWLPDVVPTGVALAIAFTVLAVTALAELFRRLMQAFDLRDDTAATDHQFRNIVTCVGIVGLSFLFAFGLGERAIGPDGNLEFTITGMPGKMIMTSLNGSLPLLQLGALIAVAFLAVERPSQSRVRPAWVLPAGLALMLGLAAPWSQNREDVLVQIISGLLSPLQVVIIWIGFRRWLKPQDPDDSDDNEPSFRKKLLLKAAKSPATKSAADLASAKAGHDLLEAGPRYTKIGNARRAATLAGYLSVPLVLYFVWTTLGQAHDALTGNEGVLMVFAALVTEAARWVVSGFVFGFFYTKIPGRVGPEKAIWFAGLWVLSCLVPTAVARGFSVDLSQQFIYRSAQFALFIIILAVLVDLATIKSAGGTWRDLRTVYSLQNYGEVVAAVAPAAFLAVTLAQQIIAGSGFDVAESFFGGIKNVIPPK
ncbi:DUF6185 family protein [Mycobacterium sp. E796]|uniref:DUF6185 family protein n=1 Tax=Mycobacterium sp. E796 TaxID=1834151 RepID=UPI0012EAC1E0|nr:DUF6185 family protein [Mycobacterium sp. E796]